MVWAGSIDEGIDASPLGFDVRDQPLCGLRINTSHWTAKAIPRATIAALVSCAAAATGAVTNCDGPALAGQIEGDGAADYLLAPP